MLLLWNLALLIPELQSKTSHPEARAFLDEFINLFKALDSEDIASAIIYALQQPSHVDVNEILIRPTEQVV